MNRYSDLVPAEKLSDLPDPVRRFMEWTGVVGQPWIRTARVHQAGRFRLGLDKPWMPMKATQLFTTDPPGFVWRARFKLYGLPLMSARDSYRDGQGHMFGKLAGVVTLFDDRSEQLTQGTLTRYLSEMGWFPTAYLGDNVTWTAVDDHSADVTLTDHGRRATGRMFFDDLGRPTLFQTTRYREVNGHYSPETWSARTTEYGQRGGLNIGTRAQAIWNLAAGDLEYGDFEIVEVAYNRPGESL